MDSPVAILTIAEAAAQLRCRRTTVFKLLAEGRLIRAPRFGKQTVVTAESVAEILALPPPQPPTARRRGRPARQLQNQEIREWLAGVRGG